MASPDRQPPTKRSKLAHHDDDTDAFSSHSAHSSLNATSAVAADGDALMSSSEDAVRRLAESMDHTSRLHLSFPAALASDSALDSLGSSSVSLDPTQPLSPYPASGEWNWSDKKILAPMVRICTLPFRRLARHYGADQVYSEELVARKLRTCVRTERRDAMGNVVVDFTPASKAAHNSGKAAAEYPMLTTYPGEPLVVQLGASNADDALAAAQVVARDAKEIGLNCGCPKHFSLQGGMGAALLRKPETLADILSTLRRNLNLPVTAKIRLLESERETVELARRAEMCGISALALHARHIEDRPRHRALPDRVRAVVDSLRIPLIYNGDVFYPHEMSELRARTGAASVMLARGAMWNPSVFRSESEGGLLPVSTVVSEYMRLALESDHFFQNAKYTVMEMLKGQVASSPLFQAVTRTKDLRALDSVLREGMPKEAALHRGQGEYRAPQVFEERPVRNAAAVEAGVAGVEVVLQPDAGPVQLSRKERRYQEKQKRKNREGRLADMMAQEAAAKAAAEAAANGQAADPAPVTAAPDIQPSPVSSPASTDNPASSSSATVASSSATAAVSSSLPSAPSAVSADPPPASSAASSPRSWHPFASSADPIPLWVETDLEPDDLLALYLLLRTRRFSLRNLLVGEGTDVSLRLMRARAYLTLLGREGLVQPARVRVMPGFASERAFEQEGMEFAPSESNPVSLLDSFEHMRQAEPNPHTLLPAYSMSLRLFLDSIPQTGGLMLLLKPPRELSACWRQVADHSSWKSLRLAAYGGFNFRCLFDSPQPEPIAQALAEQSSDGSADVGSNLAALFRSAQASLLFEPNHAFGEGASASMSPSSMPRLYSRVFGAAAEGQQQVSTPASTSEFVATLRKLIPLWNAHIDAECTASIARLEAESSRNAAQEAQLARMRLIRAAVAANPSSQLVCADQALALVLALPAFASTIEPVTLAFDPNGCSMLAPAAEGDSNVFAARGLSLGELDRIAADALEQA